FIGVEIIKNNNKLSPDAIVTDKIVNALRQKRVLISSDGPNHNVLKIKPPMVFNIQDADYLLESLEAVLKKIIR
ncbi:aspartate aminotransferase family protein, partial [bacterium]|nr:aspartate aminotransferase family protein [bacterium]